MANPQDTQGIEQKANNPSPSARRMKHEQTELLNVNAVLIYQNRDQALAVLRQCEIDLEYIGKPMPADRRVMTEDEWISEKNKYGLSLHFHDHVIANERELSENKSLVVELTQSRNKVAEDNCRLGKENYDLKKSAKNISAINENLEKENTSLLRKLKGIKKK